MKTKKIFITALTIVIALCSLVMTSCSSLFVESDVQKLLSDDLGVPVKITRLYYNEEINGCFVKFEAGLYQEEAAVHLSPKTIEYKSEINYYQNKLESLHAGMDEYSQKIDEYSDKIIESSYLEWSFQAALLEYSGEEEHNGWRRIK